MSFGQITRPPLFGSSSAEKCYVEVTVAVLTVVEVSLSSEEGKCWYTYEYDAKVRQKCVCLKKPPVNRFRWYLDGDCKTVVGGQSGGHDGFVFKMYHPANGTCPPGSCVGETPWTNHHFKQKFEVICSEEKDVCETLSNSQLRSFITDYLVRRLVDYAGESGIDCPKDDPPPDSLF